MALVVRRRRSRVGVTESACSVGHQLEQYSPSGAMARPQDERRDDVEELTSPSSTDPTATLPSLVSEVA